MKMSNDRRVIDGEMVVDDQRVFVHEDDATDENEWLINDDLELTSLNLSKDAWRVLIVDDDSDIHTVTRMALSKVCFKGRSIEFLSAYSGAEGFEIVRREKNIALILLDVVMETDDAGLQLAKRIREELQQSLVRIVLRTGQPGSAPGERIIVDYDINDYKTKTELTQDRLFTMLIASLRSYEGLLALERSRQGLTRILNSLRDPYKFTSLQEFASGILSQVSAVLEIGTTATLCVLKNNHMDVPLVIAATGSCTPLLEQVSMPQDHEWADLIAQAMQQRRCIFSSLIDVMFVGATDGHEFVIVLTPQQPLENYQLELLNVFCDRIGAAFDNLHAYDQIRKTVESLRNV